MRYAMERLEPEAEEGKALCSLRWSPWERECLRPMDGSSQADESGSKRIGDWLC